MEPKWGGISKDCKSLVSKTWIMLLVHTTSTPIGELKTSALIVALAPIRAHGRYFPRPLVLRDEPKVLTLKFLGSLSLDTMSRTCTPIKKNPKQETQKSSMYASRELQETEKKQSNKAINCKQPKTKLDKQSTSCT